MKKAICLLLAATMMLSLFSGCSNNSEPKSTGGENKVSNSGKDTITLAIEDDIESLSPFEQMSTGLADVAYNLIYERLFSISPDGETVPCLVESYERISDTEWTFKLREDVTFHDGTKLTAEDVKASLDNTLAVHPTQIHEKTTEVTGDYTFKIITPVPDAFLLSDDLTIRWNSILPKALIDSGNDFKVNPVGTGPYKFVEKATAEYLKFESYDGYRDLDTAKGRVKNIVMKVIPEPSSRTIALENGEVDLVKSVETMDIERLIENPDTQVLETKGTTNYNLTLNVERAPLDNILVRKAIAYAINPESALMATINGLGYVSRGAVPPGGLGYSEKDQASYDPEQAKEFLKEAGYEPGELNLEVLAYKTAFSRCAESLQADLADVGINLSISNVESAVMIKQTAESDYDMVILGNSGVDLQYGYMDALYHSSSIGGANRSRYSDPELDQWLDSIPATFDEEQADEIYRKCIERVQSVYGVLPMFIDNAYTAYRTGLKNVYRGPQGILYLEQIRFE